MLGNTNFTVLVWIWLAIEGTGGRFLQNTSVVLIREFFPVWGHCSVQLVTAAGSRPRSVYRCTFIEANLATLFVLKRTFGEEEIQKLLQKLFSKGKDNCLERCCCCVLMMLCWCWCVLLEFWSASKVQCFLRAYRYGWWVEPNRRSTHLGEQNRVPLNPSGWLGSHYRTELERVGSSLLRNHRTTSLQDQVLESKKDEKIHNPAGTKISWMVSTYALSWWSRKIFLTAMRNLYWCLELLVEI